MDAKTRLQFQIPVYTLKLGVYTGLTSNRARICDEGNMGNDPST